MAEFVDIIRRRLAGGHTIPAHEIQELKDSDMAMPGYTFKSFDEVVNKKTASSEWKEASDFGSMFGQALEGLPQYFDEEPENDNQQQEEQELDEAMSVSPESYDIDPDLVPPRQEWINKREARAQKELKDQQSSQQESFANNSVSEEAK